MVVAAAVVDPNNMALLQVVVVAPAVLNNTVLPPAEVAVVEVLSNTGHLVSPAPLTDPRLPLATDHPHNSNHPHHPHTDHLLPAEVIIFFTCFT